MLTATLSSSLTLPALSGAENSSADLVQVESGSAAFEVGTNMPGIEVKGKSGTLSAHVEISREGNTLHLDRIDATVPVKSLLTGMKVRDEHMRNYIFKTSAGEEPDLHFSAQKALCANRSSGHEFACQIQGELSIRGLSRSMAMTMNVKEQSGSTIMFRASGNGLVNLSDYGIEPPSQFGVKPSNQVKLHVEFTGKLKPAVVSRAGATDE